MESCGWLVDGSEASRTGFNAALAAATNVRRYRRRSHLFAGQLLRETVERFSANSGLRFFPDVRLAPYSSPLDPGRFQLHRRANGNVSPGLNEVVEQIRAPQAWPRATGRDVFIAIVDSGINGQHNEFPAWKKADGWSYDSSDAWVDPNGHGTMCAVIAAGCPRQSNSRLCGVAPDARLYSCKTDYTTSVVLAAYEWIEDRHDEHGQPIVVSNSFGFDTALPPEIDGLPVHPDHPLAVAVQDLVDRGLPVVFAAGNNHPENQPTICRPSSIWAWNSLPAVLTVAELDEREAVRPSSSRGPGQWAGPGQGKPDCAAPTYGWILFKNTYQDALDGWGTSGAAPQAAGLLAMLKEQRPQSAPPVLYERIRSRCRALGQPPNCVGSGVLDCDSTLY